MWFNHEYHFNGLVQDCSISIANALEILQWYIKPSICDTHPYDFNLFIHVVADVQACNSTTHAACTVLIIN